MPNIAVVLKEEILRPAHKEVRKQTNALKKGARIASLRPMGKRDTYARLEQLAGGSRKKPR